MALREGTQTRRPGEHCDGIGPDDVPPYDIAADVAVTRGPGCVPMDHGYDGSSGGDAQPDLTVPSVTVDSVPGKKAEISATVFNAGAGSAGPSVTRIVVDGEVLGEVATPALAPGQFTVVSLAWDLRHLKGDVSIRAVSDALGTLAEADEDNNAHTQKVTVRGTKVTPTG